MHLQHFSSQITTNNIITLQTLEPKTKREKYSQGKYIKKKTFLLKQMYSLHLKSQFPLICAMCKSMEHLALILWAPKKELITANGYFYILIGEDHHLLVPQLESVKCKSSRGGRKKQTSRGKK